MPSRRLIATAAASVRGSSTAVILRRERAQPHVPLSLSCRFSEHESDCFFSAAREVNFRCIRYSSMELNGIL